MATTKPRTTAKRPTKSSRSVRVAKKKQGVTKKQGIVAIAALALVGVVVVVATKAATAPSKIYIATRDVTTGTDAEKLASHKINWTTSDGSSKASYTKPGFHSAPLSRDKTTLATFGGATGAMSTIGINATTGAETFRTITANGNQVANSLVWLDGNKRYAYIQPKEKLVAQDANGANIKVLVDLSDPAYQNVLRCVNVSPAGNKIIYRERIQASNSSFISQRIVVMNIDGSNKQTVLNETNDGIKGCPSWSPDSKKITFLNAHNYLSVQYIDLIVINIDGSGKASIKRIAEAPGTSSESDAAKTLSENEVSGVAGHLTNWSPDGKSILYIKTENEVNNLYQVNIGTKQESKVTANYNKAVKFKKFGWLDDGRILYAYGTNTGQGAASFMNVTVKTVKANLTSRKTIYETKGTEQFLGLTY